MTRQSVVLALGLALSAATGCTVRGSGYVGVQTTPVVYQEPPAPQVETVSARPGFVWVRGRWDWQNGQWAWVGGHWERERVGYAWTEGRWERRGNSWHWIEGSWSTSTNVSVNDGNATGWQPSNQGPANGGAAPANPGNGTGWQPSNQGPANGGAAPAGGGMYPTVAPPPARVENYGAPRANFLWVAGRWDWRNGSWTWVDGHWERERANMQWFPGRWELQGNYYVWIEGRWDRAAAPPPSGPVVRDHR